MWSPPSQGLESFLDDSKRLALKTHFSTFQGFLRLALAPLEATLVALQVTRWLHGSSDTGARGSQLLAMVWIHWQWSFRQSPKGQTLKTASFLMTSTEVLQVAARTSAVVAMALPLSEVTLAPLQIRQKKHASYESFLWKLAHYACLEAHQICKAEKKNSFVSQVFYVSVKT